LTQFSGPSPRTEPSPIGDRQAERQTNFASVRCCSGAGNSTPAVSRYRRTSSDHVYRLVKRPHIAGKNSHEPPFCHHGQVWGRIWCSDNSLNSVSQRKRRIRSAGGSTRTAISPKHVPVAGRRLAAAAHIPWSITNSHHRRIRTHAVRLSFYPSALRAHDRCCAIHLEVLSTRPRRHIRLRTEARTRGS